MPTYEYKCETCGHRFENFRCGREHTCCGRDERCASPPCHD